MKKRALRCGPVAAALIAFFASCGENTAPPLAHDKLLTVADVETVSGIKGLKMVPRPPVLPPRVLDLLTFAKGDGTVVFGAMVADASLYQVLKTSEGTFLSDVSGLGDEAFEGPADSPLGHGKPTGITVRKGNRCFSLTSWRDIDGARLYLTMDQVRELAKIAVSRM